MQEARGTYNGENAKVLPNDGKATRNFGAMATRV